MNDEDESVPGLDDPISVPTKERIARYAAYLSDRTDFELALQIAATRSIFLKDMEDRLRELQEHIEPLRNIKQSIEEAFDAAEAGLEVGQRSTEKLMVALKEKMDRRNSLSKAGTRGATARAKKITPLKEWAILEGAKLKGKAPEKARQLMLKVPPALAGLSDDPERVMREAIRGAEKNAKQATRSG